jgi:hypothetical protein
MRNFKKILRLCVVPFLAISAVFWLWAKYGNEDLWWWPIVIAIILLAEVRIYLKEYELKREQIYIGK